MIEFGRISMRTATVALGLLVWCGPTGTAHAEAAAIEEVVVTGIRQSQAEALGIKRSNVNFVDAISAEEVGKLPDKNIAEALQRVTGVAIQRGRGEGDFVSIRGLGPDFVRGTTNGRTLVSATEAFDSTLSGGFPSRTGRATNFDNLPSEIIDTLEVVKSPSAEQVEGGIGGVVNVKTTRPLTIGNVASGTLEGTYRGFTEDVDPSGSALYSWANPERTLGVLAALAYSERDIREDFSRSFGWLNWGTYDTDLDGTVDRTGPTFLPLSNNVDVYEESRERLTFNGTLQAALDEATEVTVDVMYSERDLSHTQSSAILVSLPIVVGNPDGSWQVPAANFDGATLTSIPSVLGNEDVSDRQDNRDELVTLGVNFDRQMGAWNLNLDASYAKAEGRLAFDRVVVVNDAGAGGNTHFDYVVSDDGFTITDNGTADLADPGNYFIRNGRVTRTENEDEEVAVRLDVTREIDSPFLAAVKAGVRYRNRDKALDRSDFDGGFGAGLRLAAVSGGAMHGANDFLDGDWGATNFGYSDLVFGEIDPVLDYAVANGADITPKFDPLGTAEIEEETLAIYIQFDIDGELGGVGYAGNAGLRVVHTSQDIGGFSRPFTIDPSTFPASLVFTSPNAEPVAFDDDYAIVLPSLNLRFELADGFYARLAASKSLTRPTFNDLMPRATINPQATFDLNNDGVAATASLGNPQLQPYEATNVDVGAEWYFGDASAVYAGFFFKEIDEYIAGVTNLDVSYLGQVFDSVTQPDNQGEAQIVGVEVGVQQAFDSGLGYIVNATFTDNDAEFVDGGDIAFPGVSEASYNLIGYYDRGPWEARVAYSYRTDFLLLPSDVFTNELHVEGYGQLDASVSYEVTETLTLFVSGLNLTASNPEVTTDIAGVGSGFFLSEAHVGWRLAFGARAVF